MRDKDINRFGGYVGGMVLAVAMAVPFGGRYSPSLEMAFEIARVFNLTLDEIFQYPGAR